MSTHGAVAWNIHGFTIGVFNNADSYPASLGRRVWHYAKTMGLDALKARLMSTGDWEEFERGGVCEYCGKVAGQPHSIQTSNFLIQRDPETGRFKQAPDPDSRYHEHGFSSKDHLEPFKHAKFIEWVYVLDEAFNAVEVWFAVSQYGLYRYRNMGFMTTDEIDKNGYTHILFRRFSLDDTPDWLEVHKEAEILKARMGNNEL